MERAEAAEQAELAAAAAQDAEVSEEAELDETPAMHAEERPADEFDLAVDAAEPEPDAEP